MDLTISSVWMTPSLCPSPGVSLYHQSSIFNCLLGVSSEFFLMLYTKSENKLFSFCKPALPYDFPVFINGNQLHQYILLLLLSFIFIVFPPTQAGFLLNWHHPGLLISPVCHPLPFPSCRTVFFECGCDTTAPQQSSQWLPELSLFPTTGPGLFLFMLRSNRTIPSPPPPLQTCPNSAFKEMSPHTAASGHCGVGSCPVVCSPIHGDQFWVSSPALLSTWPFPPTSRSPLAPELKKAQMFSGNILSSSPVPGPLAAP